MKKLDHYLEQAIKNIDNDRKITRELLDDVVRYMSKDETRHRELDLQLLSMLKLYSARMNS